MHTRFTCVRIQYNELELDVDVDTNIASLYIHTGHRVLKHYTTTKTILIGYGRCVSPSRVTLRSMAVPKLVWTEVTFHADTQENCAFGGRYKTITTTAQLH